MKFTSKALFLASLTYLQCMSGVQAQEAPTNTNLPTALTSISASPTTSGAVPTPSLPSFINTPGLQVTAPYNDMTIFQDSVLSISASILGGRPISSINISVAKEDGSSNTTIVDIPSGEILRLTQTWNVTSALYPTGRYLFNMVITPNTTSTQSGGGVGIGPVASTTLNPSDISINPNPQPTGTVPGPPGTSPSVYYWRAKVRVVTRTPQKPKNAAPANSIHGFVGLFAAAGAIALGSVLTL
ncbi:hypothetical protein BG011_000323 [Mortierella polycephala]|uniref:Uncharacterized protein n=1 Tax=Mortierella polycephala TaxID=41804 RepID=A0A9P6QAL5_9FUNG|nr:hypothetical protein BG011_000323 [Mortierella polycephala]